MHCGVKGFSVLFLFLIEQGIHNKLLFMEQNPIPSVVIGRLGKSWGCSIQLKIPYEV